MLAITASFLVCYLGSLRPRFTQVVRGSFLCHFKTWKTKQTITNQFIKIMKKNILFIFMLMALSMAATAQNKKMKIAVMDFKAGVGVSANEVVGLSDMLINTLFETKKFDIVERSQLYEVFKEQNLQGDLTVQQCVQVGRILGVKSVLIGTVNFLAEHKNIDGSMTGEYNVDVRAVDVESGEVVTTAGAAKSSGSTYRAMMEKIGRQLAANLMNEESEVVVLKTGLLTKSDIKDLFGNYIYYLDGQRLTNKEYMELINNCPESKYYYEKGCKQRETGRILAIWVPVGCVVTGMIAGAIYGSTDHGYVVGNYSYYYNHFWADFGAGAVYGAVVGGFSALASIPFFATGKHKKENAYKVYNEYCASKPTATLSFGPATHSIGVGVYLNF